MMTKKIILTIICLTQILLAGCSTIQSINKNVSSIDFSDGISEKEAKIIAQKKMLDLEKKGYLLSLPEAETRKNYWKVVFSSLEMNKDYFIVNVKKDTGEVTYSYEGSINDVFSDKY
ncbi:MAG: hypothetical protein HQL24_05560 [Candidatus Omnitrophica bacterium]|nr:hypothetical protein [Candidatus Omnitrophota bacterium]